jgi:amidase
MIEFEPENLALPGFLNILNGDMKVDLPEYFEKYGGAGLPVKSVADVVNYNLQDTTTRLAYNQQLFEGIVADSTSLDSLNAFKKNLNKVGSSYFSTPMNEHKLDAILSINNWSAGYAAVAKFPCLTVPMGYTTEGRPMGITFIAKPFEEAKLLKIGYAFEQATKSRKVPDGYK